MGDVVSVNFTRKRRAQCRDCGEPISHQRLKAQPKALRCTQCEKEREAATKARLNRIRMREEDVIITR